MAGLKIKVPGGAQARKSNTQVESQQPSPRKKRRVATSEDEEGYSEENHTAPSPSRSHSHDQGQNVVHLFDNDVNVDVIDAVDDMNERPPRSLSPTGSTYEPTGTTSHKRSAKGSAIDSSSRKRNKKKANVVYTDEEDDYYEEKSGKRTRDDRDNDFVVDSPPHKKQGRRGAGVTRGRGRGGKAKAEVRDKEIMVKDERKIVVQSTTSESAPVSGKGPAGTKRRIDSVVETASEETIVVSQSSSSTMVAQSQSQDAQPPPQKKKLPTIKKNKPGTSTNGALAGTQPGQRTAKPPTSAPASAEIKASESAAGLPPAFGLPKKPVRAVAETTDIDLSSPDVYASLFKTAGSSTPRAGVNTKIKEEERRKELHKMRDEARAARLADLEKNTFDLLAGQEKVARFEAKLRVRNSAALYPNHLASAIKYLVQSGAVPK